MKPKKPICRFCGSSLLIFDASAMWDEEGQKFVLQSEYDDAATCQDCEHCESNGPEWVNLEDCHPTEPPVLRRDQLEEIRTMADALLNQILPQAGKLVLDISNVNELAMAIRATEER